MADLLPRIRLFFASHAGADRWGGVGWGGQPSAEGRPRVCAPASKSAYCLLAWSALKISGKHKSGHAIEKEAVGGNTDWERPGMVHDPAVTDVRVDDWWRERWVRYRRSNLGIFRTLTPCPIIRL